MLTKRINNLSASKTMSFTAKARELKEQGISVMDFSVGEPDFNTPENICNAAKEAIDAGHTRYTAVNGIKELREAIADKLQRENQVSYSPEQICVGTGAKQPLFNAVFAICEAGDEVIIPTPGWVSYEEMVKLSGAKPVFVECLEKDDFELNLEGIEKAINKNTKAIIINTPNNPTGAVYKKETLEKLGELAVKNDFYVITDEVYEKLVYGEKKHISIASCSEAIKEKCILINGFSKSYAMTGWRIGYVAADDEVITAIKGIQSHTTSSGNSITQYAGKEAYLGSQESVRLMHDEFLKRRDYLVERIAKMPYVSVRPAPGAFYLMLNIKELKGKRFENVRIDSSAVFADLLLTHAHIAFIAGEAFHADDYMRICYAASIEEIKEGMDRLEIFLKKVQA